MKEEKNTKKRELTKEEIEALAKKIGITEEALRIRIYRHGIENALKIKNKDSSKNKKIYTDPRTKTSGDWKYWCEELGISRRTFSNRIKKWGESNPETFAPKKVIKWSQEEDDLLTELYDHPRLKYLWNMKATRDGRVTRSWESICHRIKFLREKGDITSSRKFYNDEKSQWISVARLAIVLGVSNSVIERWVKEGLPIMKTKSSRSDKTKSTRFISIEKLIDWTLDPSGGLEKVSSSIKQNVTAIYWLFTKIAIYRPQENPPQK